MHRYPSLWPLPETLANVSTKSLMRHANSVPSLVASSACFCTSLASLVAAAASAACAAAVELCVSATASVLAASHFATASAFSAAASASVSAAAAATLSAFDVKQSSCAFSSFRPFALFVASPVPMHAVATTHKTHAARLLCHLPSLSFPLPPHAAPTARHSLPNAACAPRFAERHFTSANSPWSQARVTFPCSAPLRSFPGHLPRSPSAAQRDLLAPVAARRPSGLPPSLCAFCLVSCLPSPRQFSLFVALVSTSLPPCAPPQTLLDARSRCRHLLSPHCHLRPRLSLRAAWRTLEHVHVTPRDQRRPGHAAFGAHTPVPFGDRGHRPPSRASLGPAPKEVAGVRRCRRCVRRAGSAPRRQNLCRPKGVVERGARGCPCGPASARVSAPRLGLVSAGAAPLTEHASDSTSRRAGRCRTTNEARAVRAGRARRRRPDGGPRSAAAYRTSRKTGVARAPLSEALVGTPTASRGVTAASKCGRRLRRCAVSSRRKTSKALTGQAWQQKTATRHRRAAQKGGDSTRPRRPRANAARRRRAGRTRVRERR
ncbi:hypothetical protein ERJ75_000897800 [Trypanosoma vivax]|nr:hypothetical protein ERJ75_000897800 [Trypanosoma vivax]